MKELPLPLLQVLPSRLYCQVAPSSMRATLTVPLLVMASLLLPLLVANDRPRPSGAVASIVKLRELTLLVLPATSICRT